MNDTMRIVPPQAQRNGSTSKTFAISRTHWTSPRLRDLGGPPAEGR